MRVFHSAVVVRSRLRRVISTSTTIDEHRAQRSLVLTEGRAEARCVHARADRQGDRAFARGLFANSRRSSRSASAPLGSIARARRTSRRVARGDAQLAGTVPTRRAGAYGQTPASAAVSLGLGRLSAAPTCSRGVGGRQREESNSWRGTDKAVAF